MPASQQLIFDFRYDMLCIEGIALNLNVFLNRMTLPNFRLKAPPGGELQTMYVEEAVSTFFLPSNHLTQFVPDPTSQAFGVMRHSQKCQVHQRSI
jgi:hypothetical protein